MARVKSPLLFSKYFRISKDSIENYGLIDPFLNVDTQLFIDPVLLSKSSFTEISNDAYQHFRQHFNNYIRLLDISEKRNDAAWKAARKLLDLREPPQTGLGYGGSSRSGNSRPEEVRTAIMRTSQEIINLGSKDPEMISLMGFLEDNVGPDTISDFTTRVIMSDLAKITEEFCQKNNIPIKSFSSLQNRKLPVYNGKPIILVPRDIVRDLPVANDWSAIETAALKNKEIRDRVNSYLAGIAKPTIADRKAALKYVALGSAEDFEGFLNT